MVDSFSGLIYKALKWLKSLTKVLLKNAFFETILIFFATFISQVLIILAMVTPLKVIMLLGSNTIPLFFPKSWHSLEKDLLIIYLAIAAVCFFIGFLISEKIIFLYSDKGSLKILENNNKLILFENQDKITQKIYKKLVKALADMVFVIISLFILSFFYKNSVLRVIFISF